MEEFDVQQHLLDTESPTLQLQDPLFLELRRQGNVQGGALLIYKIIMNVLVFAVIFVVSFAEAFKLAFTGGPEVDLNALIEAVTDSTMDAMGWGYLAAVAFGWFILRLWKKNTFFQL